MVAQLLANDIAGLPRRGGVELVDSGLLPEPAIESAKIGDRIDAARVCDFHCVLQLVAEQGDQRPAGEDAVQMDLQEVVGRAPRQEAQRAAAVQRHVGP